MKLELKKIKLGPGSEETTQFTAELYVNGKFAAHCDNSGKGGPTDIRAYGKGDQKLVDEAEKYCATLPPLDLGGGTSIPMNLEHWVDDQVYKAEKEKEIKRVLLKLNKKCEKGIIALSQSLLDEFKAGKSVDVSYREWNVKVPISSLSDTQKRSYVLQISNVLKGDEFIYNENLPKL